MKKGIIYSFIISMVICMIMPFNIYADTISNANIVSYSKNIEFVSSSDTFNLKTSPTATIPSAHRLYNFSVTGILDSEYVGYANILINYSYISYEYDSSLQYYVRNNKTNISSQYVFINGNNFCWSSSFQQLEAISNTFLTENSISINSITVYSSNVVQKSVIDSIDDLADILTNQLSELESANITLQDMSDYLFNITQMHDYNIPICSFPFVYYQIKNSYNKLYFVNNLIGYSFPMFKYSTNDSIYRFYYQSNTGFRMIFICDQNIRGGILSNYFSLSPNNINATFRINQSVLFGQGIIDNTMYLIDVSFVASSNGTETFKYIGTNDLLFVPLWAGIEDFNKFPTDFALQIGRSNQLLDDLHVISQGTQQSQSAAGDLEQGTSDLASDISYYNQIESDYNNQMNQALNNIDFSDQFSNNQNFLSGASFVKSVFNSFMQIDILRIFFIVLCIVLIAKRFI